MPALQEKINVAVPLTEEEIKEKDDLLKEGFETWSKRDFQQFIKACEKYGRADLDRLCKEVDTKTPEEVFEYQKVFWERYEELQGWEQFIAQIEKGEEKIERKQLIQQVTL